MTSESKQLFIKQAAVLNLGRDLSTIKTGKERTALINTIADNYCKAVDSDNAVLKDANISALMLLFWGEIDKMKKKCVGVTSYDYDDFVQHLSLCIQNAMKYRAWQDSAKNTSAEACIRSSISTRGAAALLVESNQERNVVNAKTVSLEALALSEDGNQRDYIEATFAEQEEHASGAADVVQIFLDRNKIVEAIILDCIAFGDSYRTIKEKRKGSTITTDSEGNEVETAYDYSVSKAKFSKTEFSKFLKALPADYKQYFLRKYSVGKVFGQDKFAHPEAAFDAALKLIQETALKPSQETKNNHVIYENLAKTLAIAKANERKLRDLLL